MNTCKKCYSRKKTNKNHQLNLASQLPSSVNCPYCGSSRKENKGYRSSGKKRFVCRDCGRNWTFTETNRSTGFQREVPLAEIKLYLQKQANSNQTIIMYYREDSEPRIIRNCKLDDKYIYVKSDKGYYYKYLIDMIRKI